MKQYIRTPSEIYDLDDLYVCEELNGKPYGVKGSGFCIYKESIIKTADTIEELCDRFVLSDIDIIHIDFEDMKYRFKDYDMWYDITETELRQGIYGAIWTDKGLIYVAKMSEQGEWKLL